MPIEDRVTAFVPAYNEEALLAGVLGPLVQTQRAGYVDSILVVDDGSSDATAEIARAYQVELIRHLSTYGAPENRGKMAACATALRRCKELGSSILFMTDADMIGLTPENIATLVGSIAGDDGVDMVVSNSQQGTQSCPYSDSGFRAVRIENLEPMISTEHPLYALVSSFADPPDGIYGGYMLECCIEVLVAENEGSTRKLPLGLESRARGAGTHGVKQLGLCLDWAHAVMQVWTSEGSAACSEMLRELSFRAYTDQYRVVD